MDLSQEKQKTVAVSKGQTNKDSPVKVKLSSRKTTKVESSQGSSPSLEMTDLSRGNDVALPKGGRRIDFLLIFFIFLLGVNLLAVFLLKREKESFLNLKTKVSSYPRFKEKDAASLLAKIEELNKAFLDEQGVIDFIQNIEKKKRSFKTLNLSFESDQPEGKDQKYLPFVLETSGSFSEVYSFFQKLLKAPLVLEIKTVEFKSPDGFSLEASMLLSGNLYVSESF